jgi:Tat protein secretion system quality control protein TatD with DNase activity
VAEEIATLRDMTPEEVIRITEENGRKLYHIKD